MTTNPAPRDAETMLREEFIPAWNSQDVDRIVDLFAPDAVMTTPPLPGAPSTFTGHDEIRQAAQLYAPGFHAELTGTQSQGNTVRFTAQARADAVAQMGLDSLDQDNELVYTGEKVQSFRIEFTPETYAKIQAVMAQAGGAG
jgi:hypothetical protein